jgi:O-antigen chain-terminating methyltransferase
MTPNLPELKTLVDALSEVYQPIYGHSELSRFEPRSCEERLQQIVKVHDALARHLQRPVRVLDLGCAQGWFSLHLAHAGAQVLGIDYQAANINVCNMLVLENRHLSVRFKVMEIEQVPELLQDNAFDLVLGLSVFHHLCLHNGKEATRALLGGIAEKTSVCLLELALASEPTHWAPAQPESPEYLIAQIPFYRVLSYHATHLSAVSRPLYFCSRHLWYLNDAIDAFTQWHDNGRGRRYFFGDKRLAKLYRTTGEYGAINRYALTHAAAFLQKPPEGYVWAPALIDAGKTPDSAWLVQEKIQGEMLGALMQAGTAYDARQIVRGVLQQLAVLERAGLFHADVRVWNIVVDETGFPRLIDYNEISEAKRDCVWPESPFLAFLIFVNEVVTRRQLGTELSRPPFISPHNLPEPYRFWALQLWRQPVSTWRFAFLLETLDTLSDHPANAADDADALWMQCIEQNLYTTHETIQAMSGLLRQIHAVVMADHKKR